MFTEIMARLEAEVPEVRYINQDLGQLENYTDRPAVSFPCILIDFEDFDFSDMAENTQMGEGTILIKVAMNPFSDSSSLTEQAVRVKALNYNEICWKAHKALQGWQGESFGALMRTADKKVPREDALRVRETLYSCVFQDYTTADTYNTIPVVLEIENDFNSPEEIEPPPFIPV
jgi:hypothetical protein